jgi:hypothetical protein
VGRGLHGTGQKPLDGGLGCVGDFMASAHRQAPIHLDEVLDKDPVAEEARP